MRVSLRRIAPIAAGLALLSTVLVTDSGFLPPAGADGAPVTGSFFIDFDRDGMIDPGERVLPGDPLLPPDGITVTAYDVDNTGAACSTTDVAYSCDVSTLTGTSFRLEFTLSAADAAAGYAETFRGPDSASSVQFINAGETADFGIVPPSQCPTDGEGFGGNPNSSEGKVWTTCYVSGLRTAGGAQDVVVGLNYDRSGAIEKIGYKNGGTAADNTTDPAEDELGALWGVAYDEWNSVLFSSAVLKRHVDLGSEGLDGLYWLAYPSGEWQSVSLGDLGGSAFGPDPVGRDLPAVPTDPSYDTAVYPRVGKSGIGDIDLAPDGRTLAVTNLEAKAVAVYDVTNAVGGTDPTYLREWPIANPGCPDGANPNDYQPWALTVIDPTTAYVGITCTAENAPGPNEHLLMEAHMVQLDLTTGAQTGLVVIPLDYVHGCGDTYLNACDGSLTLPDGSTVNNPTVANWHGWRPNFEPEDLGYRADADVYIVNHAQPLFSDIEIDDDGSLTLGFADRFAMQMGWWNYAPDPLDPAYAYQTTGGENTTLYQPDLAGEILRVCNTTGDPTNVMWVFEGLPGCAVNATDTSGLDPTVRGGFHNGPFASGEFYPNELHSPGFLVHNETAQGGLYNRPFSDEILTTAMDPTDFNEFGFEFFSNIDGSADSFSLTGGDISADPQGLQAKGASLGDVEGCFIPIEIGDFVWLDLDRDGIQDPGETPLAGVTVTITGPGLPAGGVTTMTDANGNWVFDSGHGITHGTTYTVTIDVSSNTTPLPGSFTNTDLSETTADNGTNDLHDSDVTGGTITVATGDPGVNDHSFDAGYVLPVTWDVALRKTVDSASLDIDNRTVTFDIEVFNQSTAPIHDFEVTDYLDGSVWQGFDTGVNGDGTTTGDQLLDFSWDAADVLNPVVSIDGVLPPDESVSIPVTVTWVDPLPVGTTELANWAEISNFDDDGDDSNGNAADGALIDVDSTPDNTNGIDGSQGAGEDPAADHVDDEIDEDGTAGGDEDDHDVASVTWHDLTLIKTRSAGQDYIVDLSATPPTISFDITVKNQGLGDATGIEVTDYLPAGTVYDSAVVPAGVTDNSDGTFVIDALATGDEATITLVLEITDVNEPEFVNGAEISAFLDAGGQVVPDIDSTPDDSDGDGIILNPLDPDDDRNSHNDIDYDSDSDGNVHEMSDVDEDDHDVEVVVAGYDQALQKTINAVSAPLFPGGTVTFDLTVTNQGAPVERLEIADYIDPALFEAITIDATTNAPGTATGTATNPFGYTWSGDGTVTPSVLIVPTTPGDTLAPGETVVVPLTLTVSPTWDGSDLENWAEISLFDDNGDSGDGDSAQAGTGTQLVDVDSTPDAVDGSDGSQGPGEDPAADHIDDEIAENGTSGGDEDDHDVASIPIYDVALIKDLGAGQAYILDLSTTPLQARFTITVKNQGNHPVTNVGVTEHAPTGTTVNGAVTDGLLPSGVTRTGNVFTIAGPMAPGDVVSFDVVLDVSDLTAGPYLNEAEISAVADALGAPVTDIDSIVDGAQGNDLVAPNPTDPDNPDNSHDDVDNDRSPTGIPLSTPDDDDDHGQEAVDLPFDQALRKTIDLSQPALVDGVQVGDLITFDLTIVNQGRAVQTLVVDDDVQAGLSYDQLDNPGGTVTDDGDLDSLAYSWGPGPTVTITGDALDLGESITIPVALTVDAAWTGGALSNWAEISNFDDDQSSANGNSADGTLVDVDSTPDSTNGNDGSQGPGEDPAVDHVDDEIDEDGTAGGDEDDHDVAILPVWDLSLIKTLAAGQGPTVDLSVTPPTVSFDITVVNQGSEPAYTIGVTDYLPAGTTYDSSVAPSGVTDDGGGLFTIDQLDPGDDVSFTVTLEVTNLAIDSFLNTAEIDSFDDDADTSNTIPDWVVDVDSVPDDDDDDDVIDHDELDYDPDDDNNLNESTTGDEDDHDIELVTLPFDQALRKTLAAAPAPPDTLFPGGAVTFDIEIFNQGRSIETVAVTDYIDTTLWTVFDTSANDTAFTPVTGGTATAAYQYRWTGSGAAPVAEIVPVTAGDTLAQGESVVIQITLIVADYWDGSSDLVNLSEISNFDDDPTAPGDAASGALADEDSTPDTVNDEYDPDDPINDALVDNEIDGAGGDEDDHDIASLPGYYDLALINTLSPGQNFSIAPVVGQTVGFDVTVKNQGTLTAFDIGVTDVPPTGMSYGPAGSMPTQTNTGTAVTVTDNGDGTFTISELGPGEWVVIPVVLTLDDVTPEDFVNGAEITVFDDGDLTTGTSDDVDGPRDIDSVPNTDPTDDATDTGDGIDPAGNDDRNSHNDIDVDRDGDNNPIATPGDEDDHDTEVVVLHYDLAVRKTIDPAATTFPPVPGDTVTFLIEVINQGRTVEQIELVDYVDSVWGDFDPTINPDGTTGGSSTLPYSWNATDPANPVVTVDGAVALDDSVTVPVRFTIPANPAALTTNRVEISAFDNDGNPATPAPADIDSTPDTIDDDPVTDDEVEENVGTGDTSGDGVVDEDDHDQAQLLLLDLALRNVLDPSTPLPAVTGEPVTFLIEVINQGSVPARDITVADYVDQSMWAAFDVARNPAGVTSGDRALSYSWAAAGTDGTLTIDGIIDPGETVIVPVTLTVSAGADLESLQNTAEISGAVATGETGEELFHADGSPIVDVDSTPDTTNDDTTVDDEVGNAGGDEDDHDIALVAAPTYSLGNQVWFDEDNDGTFDTGETPIADVWVELFADADGDGQPDDTDGDGVITSADAVATTGTDPDGLYLFTDLPAGDYIVGIPPMEWDVDGPLYAMLSSDPTATDPNDDVDGDDNGAPGDHGYVWSGVVTLDDSEPTSEDPDNDPGSSDVVSNLTIDFGFWRPNFDLALTKRLANGTDPASVELGSIVVWSIEVVNQGDVRAVDAEVIDYLPDGLELADSAWIATDVGVTRVIAGPIEPGETSAITLATKITGEGVIENPAEIASATPINARGDTLTMPNGQILPDIDSVADALNDGTDTADGEDDHDVAALTVSRSGAGGMPTLAFTGGRARTLLAVAIVLLAAGLAAVIGVRNGRQRTVKI